MINSKVNGNHEILMQKQIGKFFLSNRDLNHCPLEQKSSVLPMSTFLFDLIFIQIFLAISVLCHQCGSLFSGASGNAGCTQFDESKSDQVN